MLVDFDPEQVRPSGVLNAVRGHALHAQMIAF